MPAKVVPLRATFTEEEALFEITELTVGARLIYRGKQRSRDGLIYRIVGVTSGATYGRSRPRKVRMASDYRDEVALQSEGPSDEGYRSLQAGYLRQSAHWRMV